MLRRLIECQPYQRLLEDLTSRIVCRRHGQLLGVSQKRSSRRLSQSNDSFDSPTGEFEEDVLVPGMPIVALLTDESLPTLMQMLNSKSVGNFLCH